MGRYKKNDTGIIYCYTGPNGKSYIGQTWNEKTRKTVHKNCAGRCTAFYSAIRKYGYENFSYDVLHSGVLTQDEMDRLEKLEIKERNTISPYGYNLDEGGANGKTSEETRKRQSLAKKGKPGKPWREEDKERRSAIIRSRMTDEYKRKLSIAKGGTGIAGESTRLKNEERRRLRKIDMENHPEKYIKVKTTKHRERGQYKRTKPAWNKGMKGKGLYSTGRGIPVICIETGQIFRRIYDVRIPELKIWPAAVNRVCHGYELTAGGLHFEFLNGPKPDLSKLKYHKKTWHEVDRRIKRVRCLETGIEYNSMNIAGKANGMSGSSIAWAIRNDKASKGLHWEVVGIIERKKK